MLNFGVSGSDILLKFRTQKRERRTTEWLARMNGIECIASCQLPALLSDEF